MDRHAAKLDELGSTVDADRARLAPLQCNDLAPNQYPMERVVSGERFRDVIVEVRHQGRPDVDSVHSPCSLVATDRDRNPSCRALLLKDVSE